MFRLVQKLEVDGEAEMAAKFQKEFQTVFLPLLKDFKKLAFFTGEVHCTDDGDEGMIVLQRWEDVEKSDKYPHGEMAVFTYIGPGLVKEKF